MSEKKRKSMVNQKNKGCNKNGHPTVDSKTKEGLRILLNSFRDDDTSTG